MRRDLDTPLAALASYSIAGLVGNHLIAGERVDRDLDTRLAALASYSIAGGWLPNHSIAGAPAGMENA